MAAEFDVNGVFEARRHGWHEGWGRSLSLRFPCICSQRIDGELHPSQNTRNTLRSMSAGESAWRTGSARSAGFATVRPHRREYRCDSEPLVECRGAREHGSCERLQLGIIACNLLPAVWQG
jgi:hypothetical protein